ncbi:MAG: RsmB/NOP family class I SAM-dependent RNA methyltransferase [Treponema sp.]|nr:RsmB/NOP family class I SAM-dependent RNA methyltransferase [Treponema sp.]
MLSKKTESNNKRGSLGFEDYYSSLFEDSWNELKEALLLDPKYVQVEYPECRPYFMDSASVCAALCLPLDDAKDVLDLCAAPGGKTIVLSANISPDAILTSNERSPERKARLSKVISESIPESISKRIQVKCSDGSTWCRKITDCFDSILLDAPCSSERHVLKDKKYLEQWSPARIKTLSMEQWSLLSCAWRLLRSGGHLLYSTCALSPEENDKVVSRLFKKFDDVNLVPKEEIHSIFVDNLKSLQDKCPGINGIEEIFEAALQTECGYHLLPHKTQGSGPIYFSLLRKRPGSE